MAWCGPRSPQPVPCERGRIVPRGCGAGRIVPRGCRAGREPGRVAGRTLRGGPSEGLDESSVAGVRRGDVLDAEDALHRPPAALGGDDLVRHGASPGRACGIGAPRPGHRTASGRRWGARAATVVRSRRSGMTCARRPPERSRAVRIGICHRESPRCRARPSRPWPDRRGRGGAGRDTGSAAWRTHSREPLRLGGFRRLRRCLPARASRCRAAPPGSSGASAGRSSRSRPAARPRRGRSIPRHSLERRPGRGSDHPPQDDQTPDVRPR